MRDKNLYDQLSANGNSRKRTSPVTDAVFNFPFYPFFLT